MQLRHDTTSMELNWLSYGLIRFDENPRHEKKEQLVTGYKAREKLLFNALRTITNGKWHLTRMLLDILNTTLNTVINRMTANHNVIGL